jgi:hypothetical protein
MYQICAVRAMRSACVDIFILYTFVRMFLFLILACRLPDSSPSFFFILSPSHVRSLRLVWSAFRPPSWLRLAEMCDWLKKSAWMCTTFFSSSPFCSFLPYVDLIPHRWTRNARCSRVQVVFWCWACASWTWSMGRQIPEGHWNEYVMLVCWNQSPVFSSFVLFNFDWLKCVGGSLSQLKSIGFFSFFLFSFEL